MTLNHDDDDLESGTVMITLTRVLRLAPTLAV